MLSIITRKPANKYPIKLQTRPKTVSKGDSDVLSSNIKRKTLCLRAQTKIIQVISVNWAQFAHLSAGISSACSLRAGDSKQPTELISGQRDFDFRRRKGRTRG